MAQFTGFTEADFAGFLIPTLEERMAFIKEGPRPKLEAIGKDLAPFLTELTGQPMYPITAKHLRRRVNPPDDTWVAWSISKRGYKMHPHYQVGLWHTHAFIQAGVIYEAKCKLPVAEKIFEWGMALKETLPHHYRWMVDSRQPKGLTNGEMTAFDFEFIGKGLLLRTKSDCLVGLSVDAAEVVRLGSAFADLARSVMEQILPIYKLAFD